MTIDALDARILALHQAIADRLHTRWGWISHYWLAAQGFAASVTAIVVYMVVCPSVIAAAAMLINGVVDIASFRRSLAAHNAWLRDGKPHYLGEFRPIRLLSLAFFSLIAGALLFAILFGFSWEYVFASSVALGFMLANVMAYYFSSCNVPTPIEREEWQPAYQNVTR